MIFAMKTWLLVFIMVRAVLMKTWKDVEKNENFKLSVRFKL
jgi:hypothetical protein